jgi:hypothetical protein
MNAVEPLLSGISRKIPFSDAERSNAVTNMYAMSQTFGSFSHFFTFAMDETNDIVSIRLSYPKMDKNNFPSSPYLNIDENGKTNTLVEVIRNDVIQIFVVIDVFFLFFFVFFLFFFFFIHPSIHQLYYMRYEVYLIFVIFVDIF